MTDQSFLDLAAILLGGGLLVSGIRAIYRRRAEVPETYTGSAAVRLGWLWLLMGSLFIAAVVFDGAPLKALFRLFLAS
jgi:hypothetical protein